MANECPKCQTNNPDSVKFCGECGTSLLVSKDIPRPDGLTLTASPSKIQDTPLKQQVDFSLTDGQNFGPYQIIRPLGKGGMGEVYEAEHVENARRVAIKILNQALTSQTDRERFLSEGRLAASLNHPNSVYIYGTEEIDGNLVISMELLPGDTLKDRVKQEGPLHPIEAVDVILQVIEGLEAAQAVGILHRDVKPSNCFIDIDGMTKIGDFGLSISTLARSESQSEGNGSFVGTPSFSSPEQIRGEELDVRSDIFSVGATLYYILTGQHLFDESNPVKFMNLIQQEKPLSPNKIRPEVSKGLAETILRCLEKKRSARFSTYSDLKKSLQLYSSSASTPATLKFRFMAGIIDFFICYAVTFPLLPLIQKLQLNLPEFIRHNHFIWILPSYFILSEGIFGASLGKAILRLKVVGLFRSSPGFLRIVFRSSIFSAFINGVPYFLAVLTTKILGLKDLIYLNIESNFSFAFFIIFGFLLFASSRRKNEYAGLHELITKTRVVRKTQSAIQSLPQISADVVTDVDSKHYIGPYLVLKYLKEGEIEKIALGYDETLKRKVWIHVQENGSPAVSEIRQNISRGRRIRWINGKRTSQECWDVYEALEGEPLLRKFIKKHPWEVVGHWLLDLTTEIQSELKEKSLPSHFGLDHVWISSENKVKILDFKTPYLDSTSQNPGPLENPLDSNSYALFIKHLALSSLEGDLKSIEDIKQQTPNLPISIPVRTFLTNLGDHPKTDLQSLIEDLRTLLKKSSIVTPIIRFRLVASLTILVSLLSIMYMFFNEAVSTRHFFFKIGEFLVYIGIWSSLFVFLLREGLLFRISGLSVVIWDGSPASKTRFFLRNIIAWSPAFLWRGIFFLFPDLVDFSARYSSISEIPLPWNDILPLICVFILGIILALLTPERGVQDRIAGTYLVPR